jgi:hypothetical protein
MKFVILILNDVIGFLKIIWIWKNYLNLRNWYFNFEFWKFWLKKTFELKIYVSILKPILSIPLKNIFELEIWYLNMKIALSIL